MESSRSSTQTMTTTSSSVVETFVYIPFVEASEMGIYLLVQKTVVHNFLADSAKYVSTATVHSCNEIKSFLYSNNDYDFFLHRWNFRLNTICRSLRNGDLFTGPKDYCSQFFGDSAKYVSTATVHSSNGIKSFFYSKNDDVFF